MLYPAIPEEVLAVQLKSTVWATVPAPDNDAGAGEFVASFAKVRVPLELPVAVGAKVIENVVLCPEAKVSGSNKPLIE